jgi:hypothetical protein
MNRWFGCSVLMLVAVALPVSAGGISGKYVEARTCDVWTGPCFANAEMNLDGKHGLMAWKVDQGSMDGVRLDGLGIVAIVAASDTLGLDQTGPAKAVLLVDQRATAEQRQALVKLAHRQGGDLVRNVLSVESSPLDMTWCDCPGGSCAVVKAGSAARVETRCLNHQHDKVCGNEFAFYPPLSQGVKARPAVAVEHHFAGPEFRQTWKEADRRGAYVGSFEIP